MNISANNKICMVIGDPVDHSLSPVMHNAGYKEIGIDKDYVYVGAHVTPAYLEEAIKGLRALHIHGISVTHPHKTAVIHYLDELDETTQKIGAVNTILNDRGILKGSNTDWLGVIEPLEKVTKIQDKHVALLGAGGAARSVLYGILNKGGKVTIFNRTIETAKQLAEDFGCNFASMDELEKVRDMDILFNATSIGMHPNINETPLPKELIKKDHIVFEAIYAPFETKLLREAKEQGATVINGLEMLLYQGAAQFRLYTGHEAPVDAMRNELLKNVQ